MAGGLIRQQRKSKNKGPKRLGRNSVLREKNGKDIYINDEVEGRNYVLKGYIYMNRH
jgi:hypothetical protein